MTPHSRPRPTALPQTSIPVILRSFCSWCVAVPLLAGLLVSCRERESQPEKKSAKPQKSRKARPLDQPVAGTDKAIEEFTGAHTRIVWAEYQRRNAADAFANTDDLALKGIDTRDGKGERLLQERLDNYSRPLLTSDGQTIVFTDKEVKRKDGRKHYDPDIYRTDWSGSKPVRIADGYAVDCWRDPVAGIEWVYAARGLVASSSLTLVGQKIIRFKLDDPSVEEVVYDDGPVSPDNFQLSRDGSMACGLFPWPDAGVLIRDEHGVYRAEKRETGCWPSLAPDDSGVLWVFNGGHRGATFVARDAAKTWRVPFNNGPGMQGREMYHPRWSNHPRFLVLTGPYRPAKDSAGNVINKGGASADVYVGRFSETLDQIEAWLQVSHDELGESFPDMWVEGADQVQLSAFAPGSAPPQKNHAHADPWFAITDSLGFTWSDRHSVSRVRGGDGKMRPSVPLEAVGAARHGRLAEMIVEGGQFKLPMDADSPLCRAMTSPGMEIAVEMILLPHASADVQPAPGLRPLFGGPGVALAVAPDGALIATRELVSHRSSTPLPATPFHLMVVRHQGGFTATVNGEPLVFPRSEERAALSAEPTLVFGGGWQGGILGVAVHTRGFARAEMKKQSHLAVKRIAGFPAAASRVKVRARLKEASAMPTVEGIAPYTGALVANVYELEKVLEGRLKAKQILVKQWAMLDKTVLSGFPRQPGQSYELTLEREEDHPELNGERIMDETTAFDLEVWFDVTPPRLP
jgi:hypothetical protein